MSIILQEVLVSALEKSAQRLQQGDSFRVFHGRGGCYPGLNAFTLDFFAPVLVLTVFNGDVEEQQISGFVEWFKAQKTLPLTLCIQRRDLKVYTLDCVAGEIPEHWFAQRGELTFKLSAHKQNLGYFLDIEPGRLWLEASCRQAETKLKVLNLFAFSCSLSVVALAAGAEEVVNVDMSSAVLTSGRENHHLNTISTEKVKFLAHDILRSWGKLKKLGPYDIVLVDPPSFQKGSFVASKDYPKIIRKLPDLLVDGGKALLCLNDPQVSSEIFQSWVEDCACPLNLESALPASVDFPESGEGYLKMLVYGCGLSLSYPPL